MLRVSVYRGTPFRPTTSFRRSSRRSSSTPKPTASLTRSLRSKAIWSAPFRWTGLLCGDVGFGKTEVALRAAFKCVSDGLQVAVLVPTTILAWQHYQTMLSRFRGFPVKVEMLSRFRTAGQQREILKDLKCGKIDVIVGTHRLLQKDVGFKNLGLMIVDEEQRFGVTHKERLKQLSVGIDCLTLTATPIPRTLNMALSGIRDMSVLEEAPQDRVPVQTYVAEYDEVLIREAVRRGAAARRTGVLSAQLHRYRLRKGRFAQRGVPRCIHRCSARQNEQGGAFRGLAGDGQRRGGHPRLYDHHRDRYRRAERKYSDYRGCRSYGPFAAPSDPRTCRPVVPQARMRTLPTGAAGCSAKSRPNACRLSASSPSSAAASKLPCAIWSCAVRGTCSVPSRADVWSRSATTCISRFWRMRSTPRREYPFLPCATASSTSMSTRISPRIIFPLRQRIDALPQDRAPRVRRGTG